MRITELRNVTLGLQQQPARAGVQAHWELSFTERESGDVTWVALTDEVAEKVREKLSGGITVARPKLVVPRG